MFSCLILDKGRNRVERNKLPTPHTATKQMLLLGEFILIHLRLDDLNIQIWFRMASNLEVNLLLVTYFIDPFLYVLFPLLDETSYQGTLNQMPYFVEE